MDNNLIIKKEKAFIDDISNIYNYDSNIRHLLYLIIPAFVVKYGLSKEQLILKTFKDIQIIKSTKASKYIKAYYSSTPYEINNEFKTKKIMVIQNYNKISLIDLLDNLVHEFNHALNSTNQEIRETSKYLYLRTGLTYRIYSKQPIKFIKKDPSFILEEIINTKQTEDVIDIIKSFTSEDPELSNTIYAINAETNHKYSSNSYYLQSYICKKILENKTFINTLENLRITGNIYDINDWFDNIIGKKGKYQELINLLNKVYELEIEYSKKKLFKGISLNKIKSISNDIMKIIEQFNNNVNFK
ncbi:MAG: hypothetical protein IJI22_02660 [Bacilli bacterium]|nr:hypothetical protein [Bacilli bacterium]